jgi:hypothetical protein
MRIGDSSGSPAGFVEAIHAAAWSKVRQGLFGDVFSNRYRAVSSRYPRTALTPKKPAIPLTRAD